MRSGMFLGRRGWAISLAVLVCLLCIERAAFGQSLFTRTNADQSDWTAGGTWVEVGSPASGDWITIPANAGLRTIVSSNQAFGDPTGVNTSTNFDSEHRFRLHPGVTLTHVAGSTFDAVGPTRLRIRGNIGGGGTRTFLNQGTFNVNPGRRVRLNDNGVVFHNQGGLVQLLGADADFAFEGSNKQFVQDGGGQIVVNAGAGNDTNFIHRGYETNDFIHTGGGAPVNYQSGSFFMSTPGRGGTFNINGNTTPLGTTLDNADFTTIASGPGPGAGDVFGLAGRFDAVSIDSNAFPFGPGTGRVGIGGGGVIFDGNSASLMPTSDGGTLTVNNVGSGIVDWYQDGFETRGGTVTNNATLVKKDITGQGLATITRRFGGAGPTGTFINNGTLINEGGQRINVWDVDFINNGSFIANPGVGQSAEYSVAQGRYGDFTQAGSAQVQSGDFYFAPSGINGGFVLDNAAIQSVFPNPGDVAGGATLLVGGGGFNEVSFDAGALSAFYSGSVAGEIRRGLWAPPASANPNVTIASGVNLEYIAGNLTVGSGGTFLNEGTLNLPAGSTRTINGAGDFVNAGTINNSENALEIRLSGGGSFVNQGSFINTPGAEIRVWNGPGEFRNEGLVELNGTNTRFRIRGNDSQIYNTVDGTIRTDGTGTEIIEWSSGANRIFRNEGTIDVVSGDFHIDTTANFTVDTATAQSNELKTGTYKIHDGATFDFEFPGAAAGSIDTIGPNAAVHVGGSTANFIQLGTISDANLQGGLFIHGDASPPVPAGAFNVQSGATVGGSGTWDATTNPLTIGAGGAIAPEGIDGPIATFSVDGDLTLAAESIVALDIADPNGDPGVGFDFLDVSGTLDLPGGGQTLNVEIDGMTPHGTFSVPFAGADEINNFDDTEFALLFSEDFFPPGFGPDPFVSQIGDELFLNFSLTTPEPSSLVLGCVMVLGGGFFFWRRRRGAVV